LGGKLGLKVTVDGHALIDLRIHCLW
jgi:hypothetical protein